MRSAALAAVVLVFSLHVHGASTTNTYGSVAIATNSWWAEAVYLATDIMVSNGATLYIAGGSEVHVAGMFRVVTNSSVACQCKDTGGTNAAGEWAGVGVTIIATNMVVTTNATITASGRGYSVTGGVGNGPGGGGTNSTDGAGGGYGGQGAQGGFSWNAAGGARYGEPFQPGEPGSAGGLGNGGAGGGAMRIMVRDTCTLDGTISANGNNASGDRGGGGAGGAIWLDARMLQGSGKLTATGGTGSSYGGGAAGGRIAVYYRTNAFNRFADSTAVAGSGWTGNGQNGSLVFFDLGQNRIRVVNGRFDPPIAPTATYAMVEANPNGQIVWPTGTMVTVESSFLVGAGSSFSLGPYSALAVNCPARVLASSSLTLGGASTLDVGDILMVTGSSQIICQTIRNSATNVLGKWDGQGPTIIATNMLVATNCAIVANSRGYVARGGIGTGPGGGGTNGTDGAGGGYGGQGAPGGWSWNAPGGARYGEPYQPFEAGSAGGMWNGGAGGGAIRITVRDTCTLDGTISANGATAAGNGGGGAGGAIWLDTGMLQGFGKFTATGGNGAGNGGGAGGGRIAVYFHTNAFTRFTDSTAVAGSGWTGNGQRGSCVFFDIGLNRLIVNNGRFDPPMPMTTTYYSASITLNSEVIFVTGSVINVQTGFLVDSGSSLVFGPESTLGIACQANVINGSSLTLGGASTLDVGDILMVTGSSQIICQTIRNSATNVLGKWDAQGVTIVATNMLVATNSAITANGRGYVPLGPYGAGPGGGRTNGTDGAGGGHGGMGAPGGWSWNAVAGARYGEPYQPFEAGSAGGMWNGGAGGGAIRITVRDTCTLDGTISANGATAAGNGGGGAGGAIWLDTGMLQGFGKFTATGGNGNGNGGGAGGGRIAVYYQTNAFTAITSSTVVGGTGWTGSGQIGSLVFFDQGQNRIRVLNGRFDPPLAHTTTYDMVSIYPNGQALYPTGSVLTVESGFLVDGSSSMQIGPESRLDVACPARILNGSSLTLGGAMSFTVGDMLMVTGAAQIICQTVRNNTTNALGQWDAQGVTIVATNMLVATNSAITASGRGYVPLGPYGAGPGGGRTNGTDGAGGGHGGMGAPGGWSWNAVAGARYGEPYQPFEAGSAGGMWNGGAGGGAIRITVRDTCTLDGTISANGATAAGNGGGGAGGAIWFDTGMLQGNGKFTASGGNGNGNGGGAGGGRVAVYYQTNAFTAITSSTAVGGNGWTGYGQNGSLAFFDQGQNRIRVLNGRFDPPLAHTTTYNMVSIYPNGQALYPTGSVLAVDDGFTIDAGSSMQIGPDSSLVIACPAGILGGSSLTIGGASTLSVAEMLMVSGASQLICGTIRTATTNALGEWEGQGVYIVAHDAFVDKTSVLMANGRGYPGGVIGCGPGGGTNNVSFAGSGGGYGGQGASAGAAAGGLRYGEPFMADMSGSGGGANGGAGGGAIHLVVRDTFVLDGAMRSLGANASSGNGGGGAGGALWIECATLDGTGVFSATGGNGIGYGGGGGGGRVAVYYITNTFGTSNLFATGGNGWSGWSGTGTAVLHGPRERFVVSTGSPYTGGENHHFTMRSGTAAPVGLRVQCIASGENGANAFALPTTSRWDETIADGSDAYGYFLPDDCREDSVRLTAMGFELTLTNAADAGQPGFVASTVGFTLSNRTSIGWLRAFSATTITGAAYYADTRSTDTTLDWPGVVNCAWVPASLVVSNVNPAYRIPFDNPPEVLEATVFGTVHATASGGDNELESGVLAVEYRLDGATTWQELDPSLGINGEFSGAVVASTYPTSAHVRVRMKGAWAPRPNLPASAEVLVTGIVPEPASVAMLGMLCCMLLAGRRGNMP